MSISSHSVGTQTRSRRSPVAIALWISALLLSSGVFSGSTTASAHELAEGVGTQATFVMKRNPQTQKYQLLMEYNFGVSRFGPALNYLIRMDTDADSEVSEEEALAFTDRTGPDLLQNVDLRVNGHKVVLRIVDRWSAGLRGRIRPKSLDTYHTVECDLPPALPEGGGYWVTFHEKNFENQTCTVFTWLPPAVHDRAINFSIFDPSPPTIGMGGDYQSFGRKLTFFFDTRFRPDRLPGQVEIPTNAALRRQVKWPARPRGDHVLVKLYSEAEGGPLGSGPRPRDVGDSTPESTASSGGAEKSGESETQPAGRAERDGGLSGEGTATDGDRPRPFSRTPLTPDARTDEDPEPLSKTDSEREKIANLVERFIGGNESIWTLLGLLLLAASYGAGHALGPGHGKSMVAAYLVGTRGRIRDAVMLGVIVTFSHTFVVYLLGIGLLAVLEGSKQTTYENWIITGFGMLSGLILFSFGLFLARGRYRLATGKVPADHQHGGGWFGHTHPHLATAAQEVDPIAQEPRSESHDHGHSHDGGHAHSHGHEHAHSHEHAHKHDHAHEHSHDRLAAGPQAVARTNPSFKELLTLGFSGGMVPCPAGFVIILIAGYYKQLSIGLVILTAFSVGLGAVLVAIGVLLVLGGGSIIDRLGKRGRWFMQWSPVASALLVSVIGLYFAWRAFDIGREPVSQMLRAASEWISG